MLKTYIPRLFAIAVAAAFASSDAVAQKAQDTIRIGVLDSFSMLDHYHFSTDEAGAFSRNIHQPLIAYDEHKKKWIGVLAESFRRVGDRTIEFDLRQGVTFHNGNKFDANDVKGLLDYLRDPKVKFRFKERYTWVKEVEVLSPYKVRIHAETLISTQDLGILAYRVRLYDAETLNALKDKTEYGKTSPGTGPYRMVSLDRNSGIVVERVENHWDKSGYYPSPVKRVEGKFISDRQTQIAQLLTGGIDVMRNITVDDAANLSANPNLAVTPTSSSMLLYVTLDGAGRSPNKVMTDVRVRRAFIQAIDRKHLVTTLVPGGNIARIPGAICFDSTLACEEPAEKVYPYDPAAAKQLLIEAGYPDGIELVLHAHEPVKHIAEAIAGEVRKVGIRASVESLTIALYVKKRGDGEFTAFTGFFPAGTHPDLAVIMDFFFGANRDYWKDDNIHNIIDKGGTEFDDAKRANLYMPALARINKQAYILPISELPIVWAHNKDIFVKKNSLSAAVPILGDYGWKK